MGGSESLVLSQSSDLSGSGDHGLVRGLASNMSNMSNVSNMSNKNWTSGGSGSNGQEGHTHESLQNNFHMKIEK